MNRTKIEWTDATWNPVTGCSKISPGCLNCYAEKMAGRLKAMGVPRYAKGFDLAIHEDVFLQPLKWKTPKMVFVNSMSDLFHKDIPEKTILDIFQVMKENPMHTFQVLTKRADRLAEMAPRIDWPQNVWMGVTVESEDYFHRINDLLTVPAAIRFVSFEPLLTKIDMRHSLSKLDWIIVGGESGPGARPMDKSWAEGLHDMAKRDNVAFFFKQWGGVNKKKNGRLLFGRVWDEMPVRA